MIERAILEDDLQRHGRNAERERGAVAQRVVNAVFKQHPQQRHCRQGQENGQPGVEPKKLDKGQVDEGPDHDKFAQGEIHRLGGVVQEDKAESDDGVNGSHGKSCDDDLEHGTSPPLAIGHKFGCSGPLPLPPDGAGERAELWHDVPPTM